MSQPDAERSSRSGRLVEVPLARLHPHPANPNRMTPAQLDQLAANLVEEDDYPPPVIRPHPTRPGEFEVLDGAQRLATLRRLGYASAHCYLWPCSDAEALLLLASLNRLVGEDDAWRRAALLRDLAQLFPLDALLARLPDGASNLEIALNVMDRDLETVMRELQAQAERQLRDEPVLFSFAVDAADAPTVERALDALSPPSGKNRRGRALTALAQHYLAGADA